MRIVGFPYQTYGNTTFAAQWAPEEGSFLGADADKMQKTKRVVTNHHISAWR